MTAPKLAGQTDHGRMYARTRGGALEVPSITTVLGTLDNDMGWWEALCAFNAAWDRAGDLAHSAALPDGPDRWRQKRAANDWITQAATRDRDAAAERGDFVHNYAETWALLQIGQATEAEVDAQRRLCQEAGVESYLPHFHRFWDDWNPTVVQPEATVWNQTVGYAGTTDLLCSVNIDGRTVNVCGDYKTKRALLDRKGQPKKKDLAAYTGMQLAAAVNAEEVWIPGAAEDGSEDRWEPMTFKADVGIGIAIGPDGYVVRQYAIHHPAMFRSFRALRAAWEFYRVGPTLMSEVLPGPGGLRLPVE